jgi:hypothetical protein
MGVERTAREAAGPDAVVREPSAALGVVALVLAIATAAYALGTVGLAAVLYAPIARATSVSAGEGPPLTLAQQQVSSSVAHLKAAAMLGSLLLGLVAFPFGIVAAGPGRARRLGIAALIVLAAAAVGAALLLQLAFRIDPCLGRITCGA